MNEINLRYILTRAVMVIIFIVMTLYVVGFVKKKNRQSAIVSELKTLSSESSYFNQFSAEEAQKSLIQAIGLIADARNNGLEPQTTIERSLGIEKPYFKMEEDGDGPNVRQSMIIKSLRTNYENFLKFGYEADFHTLQSMSQGTLPPVRKGSRAGQRPEIDYIVDPALSPGLEKVLANLEIQPTKADKKKLTDIQIAVSKTLVMSLADARVIDEVAEKRILKDLERQASKLR